MARKHTVESTFRLNLLNPQHAKINEVIKGLNPKIYKSKNQFLIEACQYYIDHYGEDDFPTKEEKRLEDFITRDEMDNIREEIREAAVTEARNEVIRLLGGVISGMNCGQQAVRTAVTEQEDELQNVMDDEDVAGLAMSWMSKGE